VATCIVKTIISAPIIHKPEKCSMTISKSKEGQNSPEMNKVAFYALTTQGANLANRTAKALGSDLFLPERFQDQNLSDQYPIKETFTSLKMVLTKNFNKYQGHVLVAATGLVVRLIAPLAVNKKTDPAVVTMGQDGRFVISLLSGHLGRANDLARQVASVTGGQAVITTATDLQKVPALEVLGADLGFKVADLKTLPLISRSLCESQKVKVYDPFSFLLSHLSAWPELFEPLEEQPSVIHHSINPSVVVDYRLYPLPQKCLVFRPPALAIGLGCHRDTETSELADFVLSVLESEKISNLSMAVLATINSRSGPELAPAALAREWQLPLLSYGPEDLSSIQTPNPSETVLRKIGVSSVCEASARLAARMGPLIVDKKKAGRSTCAVARINYRL
jgi:cobalt-precorrin 5A hydrolase